MPTPMSAPGDPRRQFDFWIGRWDCTWPGGRGANEVAAICDGNVIWERFTSAGQALLGVSISMYDPRLECWVQTWMDSQGSWFHLTGRFDGAVMELVTTEVDTDGCRKRMRFADIGPDGFSWSWSRSADMAAWEPLWTIGYRRAVTGACKRD